MYRLKSDKYRKARGGYSRILKLSCSSCGELISLYQKDGPGILKRVYLDRLINFKMVNDKLVCNNCKTVLGNRSIYEKENRPVFSLIPGTISKKIVKMSEMKDL